MAKTKTFAKKPTTKRMPKQLSARTEIDAKLYRLSFDQVQHLAGYQFDGPSIQVAELWGVEEDDKGEVVLDVGVQCDARIPLAALLRRMNREHEMDSFPERLRAEPKRSA